MSYSCHVLRYLTFNVLFSNFLSFSNVSLRDLGIAGAVCLSVRPSVCHKPVLCEDKC